MGKEQAKPSKDPSAFDRWVAAQKSHDKIGAGSLEAFTRQGWKELGNVLGQAFPNSIQIDELGTLGNRATPQVVTRQMGKSVDLKKDQVVPQKAQEKELTKDKTKDKEIELDH